MKSEQKDLFLKTVGCKHLVKVRAYLVERGILNKDGEAYSRQFISLVINGRMKSEPIEKAVWDLFEKTIEEKKENQDRVVSILENAKNLTNV